MTKKKLNPDKAADPSTDSKGSPQPDSALRQPVPRSFSDGGAGGQAAQELRRRAEKKAKADEADIRGTLSPEAVRQLLHELRVHQIELEMQNEELRRAQEALESSKARYFDLYDLAPVGYFTLSEQGLILEANLTAAGLLGVTRSALVKQPISRFILQEDNDIYYLQRKQLFKTGEPQAYELRMLKKDGDPFWARVEATAAKDADGAPMGRVVLSDITERKRAEEQLGRVLTDLERSNKELDQFAYFASHDLKEPLRTISSYTRLLAERYADQLDDKAKKYIAYALDGEDRMQRLIDDLLTYSRAGARGKPPELTDSHSALGKALLNLQATREESRAVVTNDDLPMVRADASQLVQIFQNLIANAIKFRSKSPLLIHVSAQDLEHEWVFSIKDNGIGIDPQSKDRLFMIFQRLHTQQEYPGTGIGLALCKRIVERHGGRIWFESEPGKGSTFFFAISKQRRGGMDDG